MIFYILAAFLLTALLLSGLYIFLKLFKSSRRIYKAKGPYLLSAGEKRFFDALQHSIPQMMYICPKVRIADLIEMAIPETDPEFWKKFNQISQKHVDFVICSTDNFTPLLIIELDGGSHNERSRNLRDELVDAAFKDANIPIIHFKTSNIYSHNELSDLIAQTIHQAQ